METFDRPGDYLLSVVGKPDYEFFTVNNAYGQVVASIPQFNGLRFNERRAAFANLFAAAPDLLAVAKVAQAMARDLLSFPNDSLLDAKALKAVADLQRHASNAIAKAESGVRSPESGVSQPAEPEKPSPHDDPQFVAWLDAKTYEPAGTLPVVGDKYCTPSGPGGVLDAVAANVDPKCGVRGVGNGYWTPLADFKNGIARVYKRSTAAEPTPHSPLPTPAVNKGVAGA